MSYIFIYHLLLEECKYKGLTAVCADKTSASQEQVLRLSQDYGEAFVKSCTNLATNTAQPCAHHFQTAVCGWWSWILFMEGFCWGPSPTSAVTEKSLTHLLVLVAAGRTEDEQDGSGGCQLSVMRIVYPLGTLKPTWSPCTAAKGCLGTQTGSFRDHSSTLKSPHYNRIHWYVLLVPELILYDLAMWMTCIWLFFHLWVAKITDNSLGFMKQLRSMLLVPRFFRVQFIKPNLIAFVSAQAQIKTWLSQPNWSGKMLIGLLFKVAICHFVLKHKLSQPDFFSLQNWTQKIPSPRLSHWILP